MNPDMTKPIEAFFACAEDLVAQMGQDNSITRGTIHLQEQSQSSSKGFTVIIGIVGSLQGSLMLDMTREFAMHLASIMNMEKCEEIDELVMSSLGELGNLVAGGASTQLRELGHKLDITTPSLFVGNAMFASTLAVKPMHILPLNTKAGEILIKVALRENEMSAD
jgi:chemotaxis protein CheX